MKNKIKKILQVINHKLQTEKGVSLIEFITALAILIIVISSVMGSFFSVFQASRKAIAAQNVIDEGRFVLEVMAREMRTGTNFNDCGLLSPNDICFTNDANIIIRYNLNSVSKIIEKTENFGAGLPNEITFAITSTNILVDSLNFNIRGQNPPPLDYQQPFITISLTISNNALKPESELKINLQASISQRKLDA